MRKMFKRVLVCGLSITCMLSTMSPVSLVKATEYAGETSGKTVAVGKGSYSTVTKGKQVYSEQAGLVDRTTEQAWWPKRSVEGNVYLTDNVKGAMQTNDWATSFLWGTMYGDVNNPFSEPAYAYPLAYQASREGMYLTNPPVHTVTQSSGAMDYAMPLQIGYIDLAVKPSAFTPSDAKVDKITDWSYDVVMQQGNQLMKTTMTQGSPYAFFECENTDLEINFKRGTRMFVVDDSKENVLVLKILDNKENDWNYYAVFGPEGVKWNYGENKEASISKISVDLPDERPYMSIAILPDETTDYVETYEQYAYNFIVNTEVEWFYNDSTGELRTCYYVDTERKAESTARGTIFGVLPHQWKNSSLAPKAYMDATYDTVRGTMKLFEMGSMYMTSMMFSGLLPFMPDIDEKDKPQLSKYLDDFMNRGGAKYNPYMYIYEGIGDTYWTGKALNNLVNALAVAETLGETEKADKLLKSLKAELEDWFSTNDEEQDRYFYYDKEVGTLVGYPSNFGSDTQLNDHHFHYGYFIYAAAQVALRDPEWAKDKNWGSMVKELIGDIACDSRSGERYPFLRNFAPYEGHSWASGHQLFTDGNNQESSSEALNAWAGIILFGEATGDRELRDLGIYLYTTEISAVENYWFDLDKDVLSPKFRYRDESATEYDENREEIQTQASMIWGGKYVYGTWWTAEPLQVQGINLLPMTGASLYLAKDKEYIKKNYESARKLEQSYNGPDKLSNPYDRWNDIWHEYLALADPEMALENWSPTALEEGGESRAHTYHYMKSLEKHGTPDFTVQNGVLAQAFVKDGVRSYCAYNMYDSPRTYRFSDGGWIEVAPHTMYCGKSGTTNYTKPVTTEPVTTAPVTTVPVSTAPVTAEPSVSVTQTPSNEFVQKIELEDNVTIEKISDRNVQVTFKNPTLYAMINYIRDDYIIGRTKTSQYEMTKVGDTWTGDFVYVLEGSKMTMCVTYSDAKTAFGTKMKATKPITFEFTKEGMRLIETEDDDFEPEMLDVTETFVPEVPETTAPIPTNNRPNEPGFVHDIGNVGYYYSTGDTSGRVYLEKETLMATMFYSLDLGKTWRAKSMYAEGDCAMVGFAHGPETVGVSFLYVDKYGRWMYSGPYFFKHILGFFYEEGGKFVPKTYDTYEYGYELPITEEKTIKELIPIYSWAGEEPIVTDGPEPTATGPEPTAPLKEKDVKAECQYSGNVSGCINENFVVTSTGKKDIQLSKLTIRHYYSVDGNLPQSFTCNHAGLQMNVSPYYMDLTSKVKGEFKDGYVELSFDSDQVLYTGNSSFQISTMMNQKDWVSYSGFKDGNIELWYDGAKIEG